MHEKGLSTKYQSERYISFAITSTKGERERTRNNNYRHTFVVDNKLRDGA